MTRLLAICGTLTTAFGLLLKVNQLYAGREKVDLGGPIIVFGFLLLLVAVCRRLWSD